MQTLKITYWSVREQAFFVSTCQVTDVNRWMWEINPAEVFWTGGVIGNIKIEVDGKVFLDQIGRAI